MQSSIEEWRPPWTNCFTARRCPYGRARQEREPSASFLDQICRQVPRLCNNAKSLYAEFKVVDGTRFQINLPDGVPKVKLGLEVRNYRTCKVRPPPPDKSLGPVPILLWWPQHAYDIFHNGYHS